MKTARVLMAVAAAVAVLGLSSIAMAAPFQLEISVGWINSTGACTPPSPCLGFAGVGGFAGTSTRLNWDNQTAAVDSYLSIGALPDVVPFPPNVGNVGSIPIGTGETTIDVGQTVRTAQIRHTNNAIPDEDSDLASITLNTLLTLRSPDGTTEIIGAGTGGDQLIPVTFLETTNEAPCTQTSNSLGSICDDQFTFNIFEVDIPFEFEGKDYILRLRGLVDANGLLACEPAGGGVSNCLTAEDQVNDRFVVVTLLQVGVPAPASLLLLGLGLVGAGVLPSIRRRLSA